MLNLYGKSFVMTIAITDGQFDALNGFEIGLLPTTECTDAGPPAVFSTTVLTGAKRPEKVWASHAAAEHVMMPIILTGRIFVPSSPSATDADLIIAPLLGAMPSTAVNLPLTTYTESPFLMVFDNVPLYVGDDPITDLDQVLCALPSTGTSHVLATVTISEGAVGHSDTPTGWPEFNITVSGSARAEMPDGTNRMEYGNRDIWSGVYTYYYECDFPQRYWVMNAVYLDFHGSTANATYAPVRPLDFTPGVPNTYTLTSAQPPGDPFPTTVTVTLVEL